MTRHKNRADIRPVLSGRAWKKSIYKSGVQTAKKVLQQKITCKMQKSHYFKKCSDSEVRVKHFKRLIFTYFTVIVFFQVGKGDSSTEAIWSLRQGTGERLLRVSIHGENRGRGPGSELTHQGEALSKRTPPTLCLMVLVAQTQCLSVKGVPGAGVIQTPQNHSMKMRGTDKTAA